MPRGYIDRLHELGDLYADAKRNAVFVCRDPETNRITGAEIKGTLPRPDGSRFTGMAPGSRKDGGGFGSETSPGRRRSTWSNPPSMQFRFSSCGRMPGAGHAVVSTAGTTPEPRTWFAKLADAARRVCAFDNDKAGDEAAHKLRRHKFERLKPDGKDWNDDLKAARNQSQAGGSETPAQNPFATSEPDTTPSPFDP